MANFGDCVYCAAFNNLIAMNVLHSTKVYKMCGYIHDPLLDVLDAHQFSGTGTTVSCKQLFGPCWFMGQPFF